MTSDQAQKTVRLQQQFICPIWTVWFGKSEDRSVLVPQSDGTSEWAEVGEISIEQPSIDLAYVRSAVAERGKARDGHELLLTFVRNITRFTPPGHDAEDDAETLRNLIARASVLIDKVEGAP